MKSNGYTLVELMIVVAIIAVISSIAVPVYQNYVNDTYAGQAVVDMKVCALALERYYSNGFTYVGAGTAVVCTLQSPTQGTAKYTLSYQALSVTDFTIRATPVGGACGMGDCFDLTRDGTQTTP
ncbi:MAG: type IV pilin protein [Pseudomonadota bacterium]|nr:type IV pilin protein [Pseudomonadota bacterium]